MLNDYFLEDSSISVVFKDTLFGVLGLAQVLQWQREGEERGRGKVRKDAEGKTMLAKFGAFH